MIQLRDIRNHFIPHRPRLGCFSSRERDRYQHILSWDGWWQAANPEVAIPRWRCVCGDRTLDTPRTRWYSDGQLGGLFHEHDSLWVDILRRKP